MIIITQEIIYGYYFNNHKLLFSPINPYKYVSSKDVYNIELPDTIRKSNTYHTMEKLIKNKYDSPIILDSSQFLLKKEIIESITFSNRMSFTELSFEEFMINMPHLMYKNTIIYIPDYLIKYGRIFNEYENMILENINSNSNIIIFGSENVDVIPFKDDRINKQYKIIEFPRINREDMIFYIFDKIEEHQYDKYLYFIPWDKIELEKLNYELINILLFELESIKDDFSLDIITNHLLFNIINDMLDKNNVYV